MLTNRSSLATGMIMIHQQHLFKIKSGSKALVLDYSKHLPEEWRTISLQDLFPEENNDLGNIPSSNGGNSEGDGCDTPVHQNDSFQFDEMRMLEAMHANDSGSSDCSNGDTEVGLPAQVLVFTTLSLILGLLAVSREASVDCSYSCKFTCDAFFPKSFSYRVSKKLRKKLIH